MPTAFCALAIASFNVLQAMVIEPGITVFLQLPYNAAAKATLPSVLHKTPNYFQTDGIQRILEALEQEPLKWKTITYVLLLTG